MRALFLFVGFLLFGIIMFVFGYYSVNIFYSSNIKSISVETLQSEYRIVGKIIWEDDKKNTLEATLLKSSKLPKDLPTGSPAGILEIKNQTTGKIILKEESFDTPLSIHAPDIYFDSKKSIFVTWAMGGAERLQVYSVDSDSARKIFDKSYKDTYWYILVYEDYKAQIFIFTTEASIADNTSQIYKWKWNNSSFDLDGVMKSSDFIKNLNKSFVRTNAAID